PGRGQQATKDESAWPVASSGRRPRSSRRAAAQVRQEVHAQTLGDFPHPGSAGGEETAQQPACGLLLQPRLPVLGVAAQPLEDPGQLTGDHGFALAEQPPGVLHREQAIVQRESSDVSTGRQQRLLIEDRHTLEPRCFASLDFCKLPPALKCGGFPAHPAPLARGLSMPRCPVQANRAHARPTYLRPVFRLATELRVFNRLLRSPRLVSRGSSPGVPEPWYWLTFYAGSLPLPATAYVRRPDCTADRARRLSAFRFSTSLGGRAEAPGRRSSTAT